jgi:NitT/TauT family transport system ATP-binding protein
MQEELGLLWEEARFTLLFVTHSIEEALVVGNRILLLSPHPGRVRAEINSHQFGLHSTGSPEFQATANRIHRLLFEEAPAVVPVTAPALVHAADVDYEVGHEAGVAVAMAGVCAMALPLLDSYAAIDAIGRRLVV